MVIELVNQQIKECEANKQSYIVEGYPRTHVQAIALQRLKIVPDRFFILRSNESTIFQKLKQSIQGNGAPDAVPGPVLSPEQVEAAAHRALTEYTM